jgi:formylmethanofuran dehydrogenase subunit E
LKGDKNMTFKRHVPSTLSSILERATEFHGHLGPFLVIGARIGLIGLERLKTTENTPMTVAASLPLHVPFSCIIDGIQITTRCTVGNQKLTLTDSSAIKAKFERKDNGQRSIIAINPSTFEELKTKLLKKDLKKEEVEELAWRVAAIPEAELFTIS